MKLQRFVQLALLLALSQSCLFGGAGAESVDPPDARVEDTGAGGDDDMGGGSEGDMGGPLADMSMPPIDAGDLPDMPGRPDMSVPQPMFPARTNAGLISYIPFRNFDAVDVTRQLGIPLPATAQVNADGLDTNGAAVIVPQPVELLERVFQSGAFTLELFVATDDLPADIIAQFGPLQIWRRSNSTQDPDPGIRVSVGGREVQLQNALVEDTMTQLAVTLNDGQIRVYADGALVHGFFAPEDFGLDNLRPQDQVYFLGTGEQPIRVGLAALYNRALSPGEIGAHALVGARPDQTDEVTEPLSSVAAGLTVQGRAGDSNKQRILMRGDDPDTTWDALNVAPMESSLLRLQPHPVPGMLLHSRFTVRSHGRLEQPGVVGLYEVAVPWGGNATWNRREPNVPWDEPGARGAQDRAANPFGSLDLQAGQRAIFDVDATELMRGWIGGGDNQGVLFECTTCVASFMDDGLERATRPRFVTLSWQRRPEPPAAVQASVTASGDGFVSNISWSPGPNPGLDYEVYMNGFLMKRTTRSAVQIEASPDNVFAVVVVDPWGQTSEATPAQ